MAHEFHAAYRRLREILAEVEDLRRAAALLDWDRQCYMPAGGSRARADQLATLHRLAHARFTSDETGELLERLAPWAAARAPDSPEAGLIRVTRREYDRARRVPPDLVERLTRAGSRAFEAWRAAREQRRFAPFAGPFAELVELQVELTGALGYDRERYDALLDLNEPGLSTADLNRLFKRLKEVQVPLVQAVVHRRQSSAAGPRAPSPEGGDGGKPGGGSLAPGAAASVMRLCEELLRRIGFDFRRGRLDSSIHPFTTMFSTGDVRLTVRSDDDSLHNAVFATLHEGGHALYNQGIPPEFERTPLGRGASGGIHESQSRLWENLVGRSRAFWAYFLPQARAYFPELREATPEAAYRFVNAVRPGLIRVDADELTYNLHIFVRVEIEQALLDGDLQAADVPVAWAEKMREYLGLTPSDDLEGALQDIHWAWGEFGVFPSYTLGNVISVQLWEAALAAHPGIPDEIRSGSFATLLGWLREHVHRHGAVFTPAELVARATGRPLDPEPYLRYLQRKYAELYAL